MNPEVQPMLEVAFPLAVKTFEAISSNEQVGNVRVTLTEEPLGVGGGKAHAEISSYEEAEALAKDVAEHTAPIEEGASTGCGDGRELVASTTGVPVPEVAPKLFGGSVNPAVGMQVLSGDVLAGTPYEDIYEAAADKLMLPDNSRTLGAHVDTHAHGDNSNCGSLDKAQAVYGAIGANGDALRPLAEYYTKALGFQFDEQAYESQVERAKNFAASSSFDTWNGAKGTKAIENRNGVVRVLEGGDSSDEAHNHKENLIVMVLRDGIGVNKNALLEKSGKQVFIETLPQLKVKANLLVDEANEFEAQQKVRDYVQSGVLFVLGHALVVPDGSQYIMNVA